MTVSIIIAVKTWQKNLEECVAKCRELNYPDFEIIILPDELIHDGVIPNVSYEMLSRAEGRVFPAGNSLADGRDVIPLRVIVTGSVSPARKRDSGAWAARGDILAFLDDDAYPVCEWLTFALKHFSRDDVGAVGGPAVTPGTDSLMQKASGLVYASKLVSGNFAYRYIPGREQEVDDYPSCNFLLRRTVMQNLGGFKTNLWPGEDTKLCLEITKKLHLKIVYDPLVLVYHHRRMLFKAHLGQIANYALHRGYFVKRYPQTSLKLPYFIPSIFLFFVAGGGALSLVLPFRFGLIFFGLVFTYMVLAGGAAYQSVKAHATQAHQSTEDTKLLYAVFIGIIMTHLTYGAYFIKGLLTAQLKEES